VSCSADEEVAFPSTNFNARHGTAVFTCVGGPTPLGAFKQKFKHRSHEPKHRHVADARRSLRVDRLIELHIDRAIIALQQKLRSQRIAI